MARLSNKWQMDLDNVELVGMDIRTKINTYAISGLATSPDGEVYNFVVTNNLDTRYPDRFKVNWAGSKPRMPEEVGVGIGDDIRSHSKAGVDAGLYIGRGGRIAIARWAKNLVADSGLKF